MIKSKTSCSEIGWSSSSIMFNWHWNGHQLGYTTHFCHGHMAVFVDGHRDSKISGARAHIRLQTRLWHDILKCPSSVQTPWWGNPNETSWNQIEKGPLIEASFLASTPIFGQTIGLFWVTTIIYRPYLQLQPEQLWTKTLGNIVVHWGFCGFCVTRYLTTYCSNWSTSQTGRHECIRVYNMYTLWFYMLYYMYYIMYIYNYSSMYSNSPKAWYQKSQEILLPSALASSGLLPQPRWGFPKLWAPYSWMV